MNALSSHNKGRGKQKRNRDGNEPGQHSPIAECEDRNERHDERKFEKAERQDRASLKVLFSGEAVEREGHQQGENSKILAV